MILVTGASGFLGRQLVRSLSADNQRVRALYHKRPPAADLSALPGVEWVEGDLLDVYDVERMLQGITEVYHCAAIVSFDPAKSAEMLHFNPESTANLVDQAVDQGIRKLVYVSSVAALGRSDLVNKEMTEEEEWGESKYNSAYGISKYLAETEVWRGIGEGLNAVIINPGIILGPCEPGDPPYQLIRLVNNEFPYYTSGVTSWVAAEDVVKIMVSLMHSEVSAERFIVSCGNHSYREVVSLLADAMNKRPPYIAAGPFLSGLAWRWIAVKSKLTGEAPMLTRETASNANSLSFYNNKKLFTVLPDFTYQPIEAVVKKMAKQHT